MTLLIAVGMWLGGGFLLALLLGAVLGFSEQSQAAEWEIISSWQTTRRGIQETKRVPMSEAEQAAHPQRVAEAPFGKLVPPAPFAKLHLSTDNSPARQYKLPGRGRTSDQIVL